MIYLTLLALLIVVYTLSIFQSAKHFYRRGKQDGITIRRMQGR